ncbi:MAG: hypothetical protein LBK52_00635 [Deltaproteobacteria bacterium]|jgi:uncharacterized protein YfaS (alpha-2-macroglobulin family)|nr:hypothetical protein [Deltaproteobacteria bacterium]
MLKSIFTAFLGILGLTLALALSGCQEAEEAASPPPPPAGQLQPQPKAQPPAPDQRAPDSPGQPLRVLQFLPQGPVPRLNQIAVMFNQPMASLGQFGQVPEEALVLDPPLPGQKRWLNEYTLAFVPDKPVYGSLRLTAALDPALTSLSGSVLEEPASVTISLPELKVINSFIDSSSLIKDFRPIWTVIFNQEADLASLSQNTSFIVTDSSGNVTSAAAEWKKSERNIFSSPGRWAAEVQPKENLPLAAEFSLEARPGLKSLSGPLATAEKITLLSGSSPGPFMIQPDLDCGTSLKPCQEAPDDYVQLTFNNHVLVKDILPYLEFDPPYSGLDSLKKELAVSQAENGDAGAAGDGNTETGGDEEDDEAITDRSPEKSILFWLPFRALTDYRLTVKAEAKDIYGQALGTDQVYHFRTKAYEPNISFPQNSGSLETGTSPVIPVSAVGVEKVEIQGFAFTAQEAVRLFAETKIYFPFSWSPFRDDIEKFVSGRKAASAVLTPPAEAKFRPVNLGLNLDDLFGQEKLGRLLLVTALYRGKITAYSIYQVTDIGLTAKVGWTGGLIWVTDLTKGTDLPGAELEILTPGGRVIWQGTSDENGLAAIPGREALLDPLTAEERAAVVNESSRNSSLTVAARKNGQLALWNLSWDQEFNSWDLGLNYDALKPPLQGSQSLNWLLSAQPIYLPSEKIRLKGISRRLDGDLAEPLQGPVTVAVNNPQGNLLKKDTLDVTGQGTFYWELDLPAENPALGTYSVYIIKNPSYDPERANQYSQETEDYAFLGTFEVQNFRTPAFEVTFKPLPPALTGEKRTIEAEAKFHFGTPVSGQPASISVSSAAAPNPKFPALPGFDFINDFADFGDDCEDCRYAAETVFSASKTLDENGQAAFDLTVPVEKHPRPRTFNVSVTAEDTDSRPVSARTSFLVHPAKIYAGLKAGSAVAQAGQPVQLSLAAAGTEGQVQSGRTVQVQFYRRSWQTVRRRSLGAAYTYVSKKTDELISEQELATAAAPVNFSLTPPKAGYYYAVASLKDADGRLNQASVSFYVSGPEAAGWKLSNSGQLTLIPDKASYRPGDTAKILVQSPYQSGSGLLTVERAGIRRQQTFPIDSSSPLLEIPLSESDGPNVYVSVILIRGRISEKPDEYNVDLGKPTIQKGYLNLHLEGNPDLLTVSVKTDRKEYKPRQEVAVDLEVLDAEGKPAAGEAALAVVDAGLLQVGGEETYYPEKLFFKDQPLLVATVNNLSSLIGRRSWTLKGGASGGGGGLSRSPQDQNLLRSNFLNLAHFEPFVKLDENGRARVTFTLPDNLTTFKILAVATGPGRRTGTGREEIAVTQNLILRPALPVQSARGDEFLASILVTNRSDQARETTVRLTAENLELLEDGAPKTLTLAPQATAEIGWRVRSAQAGEAYLTFEAALGPEDQDSAKFKLPVIYPAPLTSEASFRELIPGTADIDLKLPADTDWERGEIKAELAPTLVTFLSAPWEALKNYELACLEQTTSRAFGALAMLRIKNWHPPASDDEAALRKIVTDQIALLNTRSLSGGYTLWPSQSDWSDRNILLSVYILDFLLEARKDGFNVSADSISQTLNFAAQKLAEYEIPAYYRLEARKALLAYFLLVQAKSGSLPPGALETAYQERKKSGLAELLYLTQAVWRQNPSRGRTEQLQELIGLISSHVNIASGTNAISEMWFSESTLTAMTLLTLAEAAPYNTLIPGLIRSLADRSRQGHFGSTKNNALILQALSTYISAAESEQPELGILVRAGDQEFLKAEFDSFMDRAVQGTVQLKDLRPQTQLLKIITAGTGRAWASVRLTAALKNPDLTPVSANGLSLSRSYTILRPGPEKSGASVFARGQLVRVTVTMMTPRSRYDLILNDYLPSGFEAVNFNLKSEDLTLADLLNPNSSGDDDGDDRAVSFWYDHEEIWPGRVMVTASYLPAGVYTYSYLIRPATPGIYTVPGPQAEEMYAPENFGRGAGQKLTVE